MAVERIHHQEIERFSVEGAYAKGDLERRDVLSISKFILESTKTSTTITQRQSNTNLAIISLI
ncbi:17915_t:CDS:1, partial [Acaulospora morrowiae]